MTFMQQFQKAEEPILLALPAGQGRRLSILAERLINMLKINIPELLKSQFFQERKQISPRASKKRKRYRKRSGLVSAEGFAVIQAQMGLFTRPDLILS